MPWKNKNTSVAVAGEDRSRNETEKTSDAKGKEVIWFHIDFMGSKNGHAEPQGMTAVYEYIKQFILPPK